MTGLYGAGAQNQSVLTGAELVDVDNGGAVKARAPVSAIAALASAFGTDAPFAVTAAVGTVISAAALSAGLINRSGPVAAFTDTTDTAANIAAANEVGFSFYIDVKNLTAFAETLQGGAGVTFVSPITIPANSIAEFLVQVVSPTAVTFNHIFTTSLAALNPEIATALNTVGAGVITGVGIAQQLVVRGGAQANAAIADTTDTAVNIIAAQPSVHVGASWEFTYENTTNANATIAAGVGVTLTGVTVVPAGAAVRYLVTYTAAGAVSMFGFLQTVPATANGTFVANGITAVVVADTRITANSVVDFGLKTIGGTPAGAPFMSAVTAGVGFSVKVPVAGDTSTYNYRIVG